MLTISEAQRRTELFLTGQMLEALRAVEYELPSFDTQLHDVDLAAVARTRVEIRHVRGASDASYLINAFDEELLMQLQLNVHRLVVVYRVPALDALDAGTLAVRLERWRIGAEHAGWKFGWRDAPIAGDPGRRFVETYCYAFAGTNFLEDEPQQLYWRTDTALPHTRRGRLQCYCSLIPVTLLAPSSSLIRTSSSVGLHRESGPAGRKPNAAAGCLICTMLIPLSQVGQYVV